METSKERRLNKTESMLIASFPAIVTEPFVRVMCVSLLILLPIPIIHNLIYGSLNSSLFVFIEFLLVLMTFLLLKKGKIQPASILLLYSMLLCMAALISFSPMGILNIASLTFPALIVVSSMVFGRKQFILFATIALISFNVLVLTSGKVILLTHPSLKTPLRHAIDATIILTVTSLASGILAGRMRRLLQASYKDRAELENKTKALEISQQRFQSTIELAVDCILIGDPTGIVIDANTKAEELSGYSRSEILGKPISFLFPESTLKRSPLRYDLLKQGHSVTSVREMLRKDGSTITIEMNSKKMPDGTYQSFVRDITERINAETKLRESEEKYRSMIEQATEGFVLLDESGKISEWNQGQEMITGLAKNYVLGKSFTDIMFELALPESKTDEFRKNIVVLVDDALKTGKAPFFGLPSVTTIVHPDGIKKQMEQIITPIRTSHGFRLGAICRDITHTVAMEAEIRKHQHLESLGLLAGGIGHDFNNLLGGIFGYVDLARDKASKTAAHPKITELLDKTMSALDMARDLSSQLLTFAKGGSPVRKAASIAELIRESTNFTLSGTNIAKQLLIPDDLWAGIVDTGQIGQVFNNLLVNAIQAMPNGGTLTIRAENVIVASGSRLVLAEGKYVKIDIKDTGLGISPDNINRIFEPFFTTKKDGSGMGLSICYSILKKHGGHITVDSKEDSGTTFTLYLPAEETQYLQNESDAINKNRPDFKRILVLDDENYVLDMISMILDDLEIDRTLCLESDKAIDTFRKAIEEKKPYDVVLLDMTIKGGVGGDKVMEELLRIDPNVKGIAMSGYANNEVIAHPQQYGFKASIRKPFTVNDLSTLLSDI